MSLFNPINTSVAGYSGSAPSPTASAGYLYSQGNEIMRVAAYFRKAIDGLYRSASAWWYKDAKEAERVKRIATDVEKRQTTAAFRDDLTAALAEWDDKKILACIQTRLDSLSGKEKEDEKRWILALLRENGFKRIAHHLEPGSRQAARPQPSSQERTGAAYRKAILKNIEDFKLAPNEESEEKLIERIRWYLDSFEGEERSRESASIAQSLRARLPAPASERVIGQFDQSQKRALQQQPLYSVQISSEQPVFTGNSSVYTFTTCVDMGLGFAAGITPNNKTRIEFFNLTSDVFTRIASASASALEPQLNPADGSYESACSGGLFHLVRNDQKPFAGIWYSSFQVGDLMTYSMQLYNIELPDKVYQPAALSGCRVAIPLNDGLGIGYAQSSLVCSVFGRSTIASADGGSIRILSSRSGEMHFFSTGSANKTALYNAGNLTGYALTDPAYGVIGVPNTPINGSVVTILTKEPNNSTSVSTYDSTKIQVISRQLLGPAPAGLADEVSIANCGPWNPDTNVWVRVAQLGLEFDGVSALKNSSSVIGGPVTYPVGLASSPSLQISCSNVTAMISYRKLDGSANFFTFKLVPYAAPVPTPAPLASTVLPPTFASTPLPATLIPSPPAIPASPPTIILNLPPIVNGTIFITPGILSVSGNVTTIGLVASNGWDLNIPVGTQIPLSVFFTNTTLSQGGGTLATPPVFKACTADQTCIYSAPQYQPVFNLDGVDWRWILGGCVIGGVVVVAGVGGTLFYFKRKGPKRDPALIRVPKKPNNDRGEYTKDKSPFEPSSQAPANGSKETKEVELVEVKAAVSEKIDERTARDQHSAHNH